MTIDWTISLGNLIVFLGSIIVSVIGWFIVTTMRNINDDLQGHEKRIIALEVEQAASRAYDRGYADAKRAADTRRTT